MTTNSTPTLNILFPTQLLLVNLLMLLAARSEYREPPLLYFPFSLIFSLLNVIQNLLECEAVIKLAQHLQENEKNYKIITPYDGQRVLIEDMMKETEDLKWEEKVYNVDSFQGNEEDYIIISLVRSLALGFLQNLRRTNVMLTRCKRGMYIISSQAFLHKGPGKDCIVGELNQYVGEIGWLRMKDLESGEFLTNPKKRVIKEA
ncbi:AAA domain-containing protein [Mycena metata]|uniref:AAA domain-containing protein n=1 Tax=Mycena metata TaxID=1033252 RepID=A0AAD7NT35_9AGAR|nr:AAA domain-containing protein [Mycena metata]